MMLSFTGRSQFTFATFRPSDAVLIPNISTPLGDVFADVSDPYFFQGSCNLTEAEVGLFIRACRATS